MRNRFGDLALRVSWRGHLAALAACCVLMLAACLAAPGARAQPAQADLHARLAALELQGRTHPAQVLATLDQLLPTLASNATARVRALILQGMLHGTNHDAEGVQRSAQALSAMAGTHPDADSAAALVQANLLTSVGPMHRAERLAKQGLAGLQADALPQLRWHLLAALAVAMESQGQLKDGLPLREQGRQVAQQLGPAWVAHALATQGQALISAGQVQAGVAQLVKAEQVAAPLNDHYELSRIHTVHGMLAAETNQVAAEREHLQRSLAHARASGSHTLVASCLGNLADYHLKTRDFGTARQMASEALALHDPESTDVAKFNLGLALIGSGQLAQGLHWAREGMAENQKRGNLSDLARFGLELGNFLEQNGHLAEAVHTFAQHRQLAYEASVQAQQQAILALQEGQEADQRQRDLQLLLRQNDLQQAALQRQTSTLRWLVAGTATAGLLALVAAALVRRMRRQTAELQQIHARLSDHAWHDALTGLPNRRQISDRLTGPQGDALLGGAGLLLIDLDHFKRVNDKLGHARGDQVLMQTAQRLRDALGPQDLLARWGGEEFVVLSPQASAQRLEALANRLLRALGSTPLQVQDHHHTVTASIGMACLPSQPAPNGRAFDDALQIADQALYQAKAAGRNRAHLAR